MGRMLALTRPLAGVMVVAVACGVAGFCCATFLPTLAAWAAVSVARGSLGAEGLPAVFCALAALAVLRGVLHYAEQSCNHYIAFRLLAHVRDLVFGKLRELAPARLAGSDRGDLVSTLTADVELLEVFFAHTVSPVCIAAVMSGIMVAFLGRYDLRLGMVALVGYLVVGLALPLLASRASGGLGRELRDRAGGLSGLVLDGLRGLAELLQFDAGERYLERLGEDSLALSGLQRRMSGLGGMGSAVAGACITLLSLAELALAAHLVVSGSLDGASAAVCVVAFLGSFGPVVALARLGTGLQATLAAGSRVLDLLDEEPQVEEVTDGAQVGFDGAELRGVSFSYEGERVLSDVSLELPRGSVVGVVGKSGSGKSTLCRLLMRFWDPDRGSILVSGERIDSLDTGCLRSLEALVEQDTQLFHDSIRDNLLIARPDATQEELEEACRAASVHDFVTSLPQGYDSMVGELGDTLSGGERQRLGLARAFLHDAPLLILDEPTSNLDSLNEGTILRSLDRQRGKRTVLLVSHRASTMSLADASFSMDDGRVS